MEKTCFYNDCEERVAFVCNCTQIPIYSCDVHLGKHAMSKGDHSSLQSLLILLDDQEIEDLGQKLIGTQKRLQDFSKFIFAETKTIIQKIANESRKLISRIETLDNKITKLMKNCLFKDSIDKDDLDEFINTSEHLLFGDSSNKNDLFNEISIFYDFSNYFKMKSNFLCYFKHNSKNLTVITIDQPDSIVPIEILNPFNQYSGYCALPNNQYFFYGGDPHTGNFCTIDIEKKIGIIKGSRKVKGYMACCYYKDKVYVFGGFDGKFLQDAERYNLITDSWEDLSPFPVFSGHGVCSILKNEIVHVGVKTQCIVVYSIPNNNYTVHGNFKIDTFKIVCNYGDTIYVFESGKLYKTNSLNFSALKVVNNNTGVANNYVVAYGTLKNDKFYFVLEDRNLYKFDLKTESILNLRKITV